jgi:hypothetical protein
MIRLHAVSLWTVLWLSTGDKLVLGAQAQQWKVTFQQAPANERSTQVLELVQRLHAVLVAGPIDELTPRAQRALGQLLHNYGT